jgi:hypothetical protein
MPDAIDLDVNERRFLSHCFYSLLVLVLVLIIEEDRA